MIVTDELQRARAKRDKTPHRAITLDDFIEQVNQREPDEAAASADWQAIIEAGERERRESRPLARLRRWLGWV